MSVNEGFGRLAVPAWRPLWMGGAVIAWLRRGRVAGAERGTDSSAHDAAVTAVVYPAVPEALARQRQPSRATNYRFRGYGNTAGRGQLHANNIFNTDRFFLTRVYDGGTPRNYGRQPGREFVLSIDVEHGTRARR